MVGTDKQLVDEDKMETMSVAPPDPDEATRGPNERDDVASGVADEDPLSAHPT